jgi:Protein of unknown function (DUF1257)
MSAFHNHPTEMDDADSLCEALKEVSGGKYVAGNHKEAVQLEGYHGDKRKNTAEIVIPRSQIGTASNDIGFKRNPDGKFEAVISDYDRHKHTAAWLNKVKAKYAEVKAKKIWAKAGHNLKTMEREEIVVDGKKVTVLRSKIPAKNLPLQQKAAAGIGFKGVK